tara:strand:+ start:78 stop:359 length:282 start_codon:yes stop_codon:yes gene_type:complete
MGIRWEDYRNRRALKVDKWSIFLGIKSHDDMKRYLLKIGVIPPDDKHSDVLMIESLNNEVPEEKEEIQKKSQVKTKRRTTRKRRSTKTKPSSK